MSAGGPAAPSLPLHLSFPARRCHPSPTPPPPPPCFPALPLPPPAARHDKVLVAQTAPAVRVSIGEEVGLPPGTAVTGKLVTALRRLGFDYVFGEPLACLPACLPLHARQVV